MDDKFSELKKRLNELVNLGTKIIKKRHIKNNPNLDSSLKNKIIDVFDYLFELDSKYNNQNFDQQIIKKKFSSNPSKEKIVNLIYKFLYNTEIKDEKQVDKMFAEILKQIKLFDINVGFFFPRELLIKKLKQLRNVKVQYLTPEIESKNQLNENIRFLLEVFKNENKISSEKAVQIIKNFEKLTESEVQIAPFKPILEQFCLILKKKCEEIQDVALKPEEERQNLNKEIKKIIYELEILYASINNADEIPILKECLKACKQIKNFSMSSKKQFSRNEQKRVKRAYSIESMGKIVRVHKQIVTKANEALKKNGFSEMDSSKLKVLDEYESMVNSNDPRILRKEFFDSAVEKIQLTVEKEINNSRKKSMFKMKDPSSDQVLKEILKLF